jgi:CheY-like chemotaxis protein
MGGRLSVTSVVGKGSTFCFIARLKSAPDAPKLRPEATTVPSPGSPTQCSLRILVADDSPDNRLLVQLYMKGSAHSLTFAEDGKEAVDQFGSADFDLVIMDLLMPVMDGLTAVGKIREIERERSRAPVPILALSANARPEDVRISLEAGCNAHLSKPISKQRLLAAVDEYGAARGNEGEPQDESTDEISQLAPAYLAARRSELPEMMRALEGGDFPGIRRLGHNLKGTGASYGFPGLSDLGAAIEASSADADAVTLERHLVELARHLAADLH